MRNITIHRYSEEDFEIWNQFISEAKNSTFLFNRDFMDYHRDRFNDFSLMIYRKNKLVAVLPCHIKDGNCYSHLGLTYGGIITNRNLKVTTFFKIFQDILLFLYEKQIPFLYWKEIPHFYTSNPNDEWKYLAFIVQAEMYRRDLNSVINLGEEYDFTTTLKNNIKSAEKLEISYKKCHSWEAFWTEILTVEMLEKYNTLPIHTLDEILLLSSKFPDNVIFYGVFLQNELVGGTVLFVNEKVVHCQYISIKSNYKNSCALHYLFYKLITEDFAGYHFFDFGISNEYEGRKINKGLLSWKESFGARGYSQDFYKISTANYNLIDQMYL